VTYTLRRRRAVRFGALAGVFLFFGVTGITHEAGAQSPDDVVAPLLVLDGPVTTVTPGEAAELRIRVDDTDSADVRVFFPDFPAGISPAGNPTLLSRGRGAIEVRIGLTADEPGRYVVEGILVATAAGLREIEPVLIEIASSSGETVPVRARWRVLAEQFYQSRSVPVILEVIGAVDYLFPDDITYRAPETGLFEEVSGIGEVSTREIGEVTVYDIPVAAFLFTPATSGEVRLPEASVRTGDAVATARAQVLNVTPIPDAAGASNAVGTFEIVSRVDTTEVNRDADATVDLEIEITGTGNLPVVAFPDIDAPGFEEIDRAERVSTEPDQTGLDGYRGVRRRTIRLEYVGAGEENAETTVITVGGYVYFDPAAARTVRIPPQRHEIVVRGGATPVDAAPTVPEFPLLTVEELSATSWYRLAELPWVLYLFLLGPIILGASALWSVRRRPPSRRTGAVAMVITIVPLLLGLTLAPSLNVERIRTAERLMEEGRPAVAGVMYDLEIADNPWHAGLHYNRGVLSLRLDRPVVATYHLRRAVRLAPQRAQFRDALAASSDYFALEDQVPIPRYPRPDYLVLALIVLWTAFWGVLSARRRLRNTLSLVGIGMLIVLVIGTLGWSWSVDRREDGVVRRPVHVRRIPDESAVPWIGLSTAQAVEIELQYESFYLVRTQAGMTGWVPRAAVWTDTDG
jgi:hypothetical protein